MWDTLKEFMNYRSSGVPILVVLSGPSGVGKDSILLQLQKLTRTWHFAVTATTRAQRPLELEGIHYMFLDGDTFQQMLREDKFLESAQVYGNWYGLPRTQVTEALNRGQDVIVKADVQGAATIRSIAPGGVFIFLMPPSPQELERRLRDRKTETTPALELRIRSAMEEMKQLDFFDYIVVNDDLNDAVRQIDSIIIEEKSRIPHRQVKL